MKQIFCLVLSLCLCLSALPFLSAAKADSGDTLSLLAINIRKGDALLLRSGKSVYLIDTGKKGQYDLLSATLAAEGISRLTGVIITHTDGDHVGGLKQLANSGIKIENVYASRWFVDEGKKHPVEKALKGTGLKAQYLSAGDSLPLDGGKLSVLGPVKADPEKENNNSLVLLAEGGGGSMLLTGDMEFPEEASLLDKGLIPHADVLKVANHGEDDATSAALLLAVTPRLAVISTNTEDEPDTPSSRVLRLLSAHNIPVLVTQDARRGILITLRNGQINTEIR